MKTLKKIQATLALISCLGFVFPTSVIGAVATPASPGSFAQDVAMGQGGVLQGKVMSTSGNAISDVKVQIQQADQVIAEVATDASGAFQFNALRGGVYQVATAGAATQFRVWAAQTAPPHAANAALLVTKSEIVRGQCCTDTSSDCGCYESCTAPSCDYEAGGCECGGGCGCGCGCGCGAVAGPRSMPWLLIAGAAAAIAIPLALDDDDAS